MSKVNPGSKAIVHQKVLMKFSEDKFYNDQKNPMFEAGKVYELDGHQWIQRWLKRGGVIVQDESIVVEAPAQQAPVVAAGEMADLSVDIPVENVEQAPEEEKVEKAPEEAKPKDKNKTKPKSK